jgi:hypothetical protein
MDKGRFTTSRINASRVRVGTVLYHGGQVTAVGRNTDGSVSITHQWGTVTLAPAYRLTYYPRLGG